MNAPGWLTSLDSLGFVTTGIFLSIIWQSSIVFLSVGLIIFFIKRVKESFKYYLWLTAILIVPVIPVLTWGLSQIGTPQKEIAVIPKYNIDYFFSETVPDNDNFSASPFTQKGIAPTIPKDQDVIYTPDKAELWAKETAVNKKIRLTDYQWALVFPLYALFLLFFLVYFLSGRAAIEKWIITGSPVLDENVLALLYELKQKIGIKREIILIENDAVKIPLTCRTIKPVIILPPELASKISEEDLTAVILHELAHIKRFDTFLITLVSVIRSVFFFHPFVWLAAKETQLLADKSCDSIVVKITEKPVSYAKMLTFIARNFSYKSFNTEHAAGFLFKKSTFLKRVESILSGHENQIKKISRIGIIFITSFAIISLFISLSMPLAEMDYSTGAPVTISGAVFYEDTPVKGAQIYVAINNSSVNNSNVVKMSKTRKDGSFTFKIDSFKLSGEHIQNKPVIFAYSPGYSIGWKKLNDNTTLKKIKIELRESTSLSGVVKDSDGQPFKGAGIEIFSILDKNCLSKEIVYSISKIIKNLKCTTDENGAFTVTNLPVNSDVCLTTFVDGYYADFTPLVVDSNEKNMQVTLKRGGKISGKIINGDTGEPAEGIYVRCGGWYGINDVRTDKNGEYFFSNIKPSEYSICIFQKKEFPEWASDIKNNIPVEGNSETANVDFKLVRGGIVTGKITDAGSGKPIPGINVIAEPLNIYRVIPLDSCKTDKNGYYRLRVQPGKIQIRTDFADGYEKSSNTSLIDIKEGENLCGINFSFRMGLSITVVALSPEGKPVPGTSLVKSESNSPPTTFRTDNRGICTFRGLGKGELLSVYAENRKLNLRGTGSVEAGNFGRLEIRMDKFETFSIGGHVFDSSGKPLSGVRFKLLDGKVIPMTMTNTGVSTADGSYTIKNLIKGNKYGLFTELDNYTQMEIPVERISKGEIGKPVNHPGEAEYIYDICLEKAERWLEGNIKDNLGNPVRGASVTNINGPGMVQAVSGNDGHYRLDNLSFLVEAEIQVTHPDYGHYRFKLIPTNTMQNFTLMKRREPVKGRIIDQNGKPAAGMIYRFDSGDKKSGMSQSGGMTDSEGHFLIDRIICKDLIMSFEKGNENFKNLKVESGKGDVTLVMNKTDVSEAKRMDSRKRPVFTNGSPPELAVSEWINCNPLKLGNLKDKTVILNFWSCEDDYSLKKIEALNIIQQAYDSRDVVIISIHENTENIRKIKKIVEDLNFKHFVTIDSKGNHEFSNGETFDRYGMFRYSNGTQYQFCTVIDTKGGIHQHIHFRELENVLKESIRNGKENS